MSAVLKVFGLGPSKGDKRIKNLVNNSYSSVQVVGRGTVKIDVNEVRNSTEFKRASEQAKAIVEAR